MIQFRDNLTILIIAFAEVSAMARLASAEEFDPSEVALLYICARVVHRC